jgi:hypothetical protein
MPIPAPGRIATSHNPTNFQAIDQERMVCCRAFAEANGSLRIGGIANMTWVEGLGWLGAVLAVTGSAMKTIIPLRVVGICANVVGLAFALAMRNHPGIAVNLILLPLNAVRLVQMLRLIRKVKKAASSDLSMDWLKPFMTRQKATAGQILFAKEDAARCSRSRTTSCASSTSRTPSSASTSFASRASGYSRTCPPWSASSPPSGPPYRRRVRARRTCPWSAPHRLL